MTEDRPDYLMNREVLRPKLKKLSQQIEVLKQQRELTETTPSEYLNISSKIWRLEYQAQQVINKLIKAGIEP